MVASSCSNSWLKSRAEPMIQPSSINAASSGPVKVDSNSCRVGGGVVNSDLQTLQIRGLVSVSNSSGCIGWEMSTVLCHQRKQLKCTYFWPPAQRHGEINSPASVPSKQKRQSGSSSSPSAPPASAGAAGMASPAAAAGMVSSSSLPWPRRLGQRSMDKLGNLKFHGRLNPRLVSAEATG